MPKSEGYYICAKEMVQPYFEVISETEPGSILDMGMLLFRCGAVGRMVCGVRIPEDVRLDGVGAESLPISRRIYDHIYEDDSWKSRVGEYDMVLAYYLDAIWSENEIKELREVCEEAGVILVSEQGVMYPEIPDTTASAAVTGGVTEQNVSCKSDIRLFACAHKQFTPPSDPIYIPLRVGSALGDDFGMTRDDSGDNISSKNPYFCELTGIYWIWKNVSCDITGICHYRRYFVNETDFLSGEDIENTLGKYDIILASSAFTEHGSVRDHYAAIHYASDLDLLRSVIEEKAPEFLPEFDHVVSTNLMSLGNMMVCRKELFDRYCSWLFDILFEVEKRADISDYDEFQARLYGYLSERLLRVWVMHEALRVYEYDVEMMDPADRANEEKRIQMTQQVVDLYLADVVKLTQMGQMQDIVQEWPSAPECLTSPDTDLGLYEGKVPVFVFYKNGADALSAKGRRCRESRMRFLPENRFLLIEIEPQDVGSYAYIPAHILEKYENGLIAMDRIADILRCMLLYRYGGLWLDEELLLESEPGAEVFDRPFYSKPDKVPIWKTDIARGRWGGVYIKTKAGDPIMGFALNAFCYFYFQTDQQVEGLFDYIMDLAHRTLGINMDGVGHGD